MQKFRTPSEAYLAVLADVVDNPEYRVSPRGQPIAEKTDYSFEVALPDASPIVTRSESRNKTIADYTHKEFEVYESGSRRVEDFAKISSFWKSLANPDGTINSSYGHLIFKNQSCGNPTYEVQRKFLNEHDGNGGSEGVNLSELERTPWEWASESLIQDKDTRQAIMHFNLPEHCWVGNRDVTCTMHGIFQIRQDKLNLSVVMRSNDVVLGLVFDLPWFMHLIDRMVAALKPTYPALTKGHYRHMAHSMHVYGRDMEKVNMMLGRGMLSGAQ